MYKVLILIMGVLLGFPTTSLAADWLKGGQAGAVATSVSVGSFVTYTPEDETDDSVLLSTTDCENIDLLYYDDTDGDGAGGVTAGIRSCPAALRAAGTAGDSTACWLIENVTLTGTTPNEAIYGAAAEWIYFDAGGAEADGDTQELIVRCNGSGTP